MLLKSIKLKNFRQYTSAMLDFSLDEKKNITLVTGEMGFGKSTLEQAFRFVLYGYSEFDNDVLLNSNAQEMCEIGKTISTEVSLDFQHLEKNYRLTRTQIYQKVSNTKIILAKVEIKALEVDKRGNTTPISQIDALTLIDQLIPKELSDYFFVDGEKIEKMTKNIKEVSRQEDFIKVVKSMLGLNHMFETLKHLEKVKTQYTRELVSLGGGNSTELERKISISTQKIESLREEIAGLKSQIEHYKSELETLGKIIQLVPNAEEFQKKYVKLGETINYLKTELLNLKLEYFKTDRTFAFYIASPLMRMAKKLLEDEKIEDKGIPSLHANTLKHIISNEKCLCGNHVTKDSKEYKIIKDLLNHVPPQSIAQSVLDFKKIIESNSDYFENAIDLQKRVMAKISDYNEKLDKAIYERDYLSKQIESIDKVSDAQAKYRFAENQINGIFVKIGGMQKEIEFQESTKRSAEDELKKMAYRVDAGHKFRKYLIYTEELIKRLSNQLKEKEDKVRSQLEATMNEHLALAYNDGFKVAIDDKYRIKVHNVRSSIGDTLDKSTGQWLTIIFAFIASVMKMAKEISMSEDPNDISEYPLVLDAPFSTIDAKFVEKISDVLRKTSRQLIIFMNIKDSEVFLKTSEKYVGRKYNLKSNSTVETFVEEVR
jgi:DNA sulfur modification protein DndD